jgi:hypothetical protein
MGTRADFYVGEGEQAEWLGSVAWDGYPDGFEGEPYENPLKATDEHDYRKRVAQMLRLRDDATHPEQGWPWPWEDSTTTDYAYSFLHGKVGGSSGHGWWFPAYEPPESGLNEEDIEKAIDAYSAQPKQAFPNMREKASTAFDGSRSGLIVFSTPNITSTTT